VIHDQYFFPGGPAKPASSQFEPIDDQRAMAYGGVPNPALPPILSQRAQRSALNSSACDDLLVPRTCRFHFDSSSQDLDIQLAVTLSVMHYLHAMDR
jgi:hypothetical protein